MNREQKRAKRRPEKNPVVEYNKIQNKYYPELLKNLVKQKTRETKATSTIL